MKTGVAKTLRIALFGAFAFWTPDVVLHLVRRYSFISLDAWILTVAMPLIAMTALFVYARATASKPAAVALRMLPGIWLLGGVFMYIGASFSGGGFSGPEGIRESLIVIAMSLVPIYTFIMATYDGSLFALLLVTLGLFFAWIFSFNVSSNAVVPPADRP